MRAFIRTLLNGRSLRHRPIVWPGPNQVRVEVLFAGSTTRIDISDGHVPIGLSPFIIGLRLSVGAAMPGTARLFFTDTTSGRALGHLDLRAQSEIQERHLRLGLYSVLATHNATANWLTKTWRYFLARRQANANMGKLGLKMTADDQIALNLYYAVPRPVFLIGTAHANAYRLFPMDLLATIDGLQVLSLRAASPSATVIAESRHVAMSAAPADAVDAIYKCGKWNLSPSADFAELPLKIRFLDSGHPALHGGGEVRHVDITYAVPHGSHMTLIGNVVSCEGTTSRQMAHMSDMYVSWLRSHGQPVETVTPE